VDPSKKKEPKVVKEEPKVYQKAAVEAKKVEIIFEE